MTDCWKNRSLQAIANDRLNAEIFQIVRDHPLITLEDVRNALNDAQIDAAEIFDVQEAAQ